MNHFGVAEIIVTDVMEIVNNNPNDARLLHLAGDLMVALEGPGHALDTLDLIAFALALRYPLHWQAAMWIVSELAGTDYANYNLHTAVDDYLFLISVDIGRVATSA